MAQWRAPLDPDCPEVKEFMTTLFEDPMTQYYGCGDEIAELWESKHRAKCARCQYFGAANIEVEV